MAESSHREAQNAAFDQEVLLLRKQGLAEKFCYQEDLQASIAAYGRHFSWSYVEQSFPSWKGKVVLDLGAGRGLASRLLERQGARVIALDMNTSEVAGLGALREDPGNVFPVAGMFEALPLAANSLDAVVCRWVLHHALNLNLLLKELHRALKTGGMLIAQAEPLLPLHWSRERFLDYHRQHFFSDGIEENAYSPMGYEQFLNRNGFRVEELGILPPLPGASIRGRWQAGVGALPLPRTIKRVLADPRLLTECTDISFRAIKL